MSINLPADSEFEFRMRETSRRIDDWFCRELGERVSPPRRAIPVSSRLHEEDDWLPHVPHDFMEQTRREIELSNRLAVELAILRTRGKR